MAEKNILSILIAAYLPDHNETLLFAGFFDTIRIQLLLYFNTVIVSSEIQSTVKDLDIDEFVHFIFEAKDNYTIDTDLNNRATDYFVGEFNAKTIESIITKHSQNDTGALSFNFKRMIDHLLQLDTTQIQMKICMTSHGALEIFNAYERRISHTVSENNEIASKYVGSNRDLIKKIVESSIADSTVAVFTVSKEGKIVSCGSVIYNELSNKLVHKNYIYAQGISFDECNLANNLVDVFHYIQEFSENCTNNDEVTNKIDNAVSKINIDRLAVIMKSADSDKVNSFFSRIMPPEITSGNLEIRVQKFNSIILDIAFEPVLLGQKSKEKALKEETVPKSKAQVEVDLVISPTKGVKVSELKSGSRIYVIINGTTIIGRKVINQLNLLDENRVKPVSAVVEEITKTSDGYIVITRIASNLLGRAIEEEDVKVKSGDPVVDKKIEKSRKSLLVGVSVGLGFILLAAISLWVLL
ncbi:MAG TPA: hypothetical protein P5123_04850 [Spirochaetota bacterium]|nr:hypothetical protein [Spirochaetota bacterium]